MNNRQLNYSYLSYIMSHPKPVQLGLCCMNITLKAQKPPVYAARRIIVRIVNEKGINELKRRILTNLDDLLKMIQWNEDNGIRVFRLSSELFQHKTNPKVPNYTFDFAKNHLKLIGQLANKYNHRALEKQTLALFRAMVKNVL